jgi:hypothetical protein
MSLCEAERSAVCRETLLNGVNANLDFEEKSCIFVIRKWGITYTQVIPLIFFPFHRKKRAFF